MLYEKYPQSDLIICASIQEGLASRVYTKYRWHQYLPEEFEASLITYRGEDKDTSAAGLYSLVQRFLPLLQDRVKAVDLEAPKVT